MTTYEIHTLAESRGYRLSRDAEGVWLLIRKHDRHVITVGYHVRAAIDILIAL